MFGGKRFSRRAINKSREETSNVDVWGWRDAAAGVLTRNKEVDS